MQEIILRPLFHRNIECIGIYFVKNIFLEKIIRRQAGIKWSQTHGCWYVPLAETNYKMLLTELKEKATIDNSLLKQYQQRKKNLQLKFPEKIQAVIKINPRLPNPAAENSSWPLSNKNSIALENFVLHLKLKAYSESTILTYRSEFIQLLKLLKKKPAEELTTDDLKRYLVYAMEKEGISENTVHSRINAIKFYFEQVLGREKLFWEIPRPKKPIRLPHFFNQNEIVSIIKATDNLKHKVMLMLAYSAGLRVSEVVVIKTRHIDESRMTIFIEQAKGKKDRLVNLSPVLLVMLREYKEQYKPDKDGFLFAGQTGGEPYSKRSMQLVVAAAKQKAGIIKPGSVHALRHSFATHLLDKGTDVTIIMKLLGHNDIKTTLRYLHVTNRDVLNVISPLDDLNLG